jgi:site-specific DNA-methyltransferase (adenine-specific)
MNTIIPGDCTDVLQRLKRAFVDLVLIDPPYNAGYEFDNDSLPRDEFLAFTRRWFSAIIPTMKETAVFACFINENYLFDFNTIFRERLMFRRLITWQFEPSYRGVGDIIDNRAEYILVFSKSNDFTFNIVREEPSNSTHDRWAGDADDDGNVPYDCLTPSLQRRYKRENYDKNPINIYRGAPQGNVIFYRRVKDNDEEAKYGRHPTQKPEALLVKFVQMFTNEGDVVMDCFAGSGSTLVVSKKQRRQFIGIESDASWVSVARMRLASVTLTDRL